MGHGQREISHTPTHWQTRGRWIEKATPRFQGLQVPNMEGVAELQVEGEAAYLPPGRNVEELLSCSRALCASIWKRSGSKK